MNLWFVEFRTAAMGFATVASLFVGVAQADNSFTHDQCRLIAAITGEVIKDIGSQKLSVQFRKSLLDFIMPSKDGQKREMTCDGSKEILTPDVNDIAAFNTISRFLYAGKKAISLSDHGVRSVDPKKVAKHDQKGRNSTTPEPDR